MGGDCGAYSITSSAATRSVCGASRPILAGIEVDSLLRRDEPLKKLTARGDVWSVASRGGGFSNNLQAGG